MKPKAQTSKPAAGESVDDFLAALVHPHKQEIAALRQIILAADRSIREAIKWNAPSFHTSDHFATMNLRAKHGVGIILHFGAKKTAISSTGVAIPDPQSLLEWLAKDRATVTFRDTTDIEAKREAFTALVREWIRHLG
ncbi:DUF1801 domain-containing protein [uncultured Paludibaculum sp.]|uniref:DUF1801 domain-containing protein n=1 Tax=uncultured Paludibaculum sp. TaxID=1765020 RepID=UPI002AABCC34|nr:DUF1801 domain-containing protein [uncultured Paludibaculum sp.]